jgi:hypothetical protein
MQANQECWWPDQGGRDSDRLGNDSDVPSQGGGVNPQIREN